MMKELIKLNNNTIGEKEVNTVNARELHEFLGSGTRYNDWFSRRVKEYGFQENIDYICLTQKRVTQTSSGKKGLAQEQNHYITLDMAKELAMVERNEKGREARKYFIECESKLREVLSTKDQCFLEIIKASSQEAILLGLNKLNTEVITPLENKVEEQEKELEISRPKAIFYDSVMESKSTFSMREVAQLLSFKKIGRNKLFALLRDWGVLDKNNVPYQRYIEEGWFRIVQSTWVHPQTGDLMSNTKTVAYQKGLDKISNKLLSLGYVKEDPVNFVDEADFL